MVTTIEHDDRMKSAGRRWTVFLLLLTVPSFFLIGCGPGRRVGEDEEFRALRKLSFLKEGGDSAEIYDLCSDIGCLGRNVFS